MFLLRLAGLCALHLLLAAGPARAASSVLIWPIDPTLPADQASTALWLENRGEAPVNLQVRVLAWAQEDNEDRYQIQTGVIGIPQVALVAPGQKQLIRLTRLAPVPAGTEQAFRVVIDEIPPPREASDVAADAALRFSMRYLVPLFSYGAGVGPKPSEAGKADAALVTAPVLHWKQVQQQGRPVLELHNSGQVHARITDVSVQGDVDATPLFEGLLGYVLPGSTRQWPLAAPLAADALLLMHVNGELQLQHGVVD